MMQLLKLAHNSWSENLLKELNSMRSMNQMCDIKLVLEGDSAVAHSCVLAAASPFFKTILSGTENLEINLESFPRRIVIYMLDFIYNGILLFPKEDLDLLHSIANILNIPSLLDLTQEMLKHCTASDLQDAKLKPNLEQPSSELSHDDANKQTLVQHPQTSDELVIEEQFSGQVHPAHSLSNLPVSLNLVDVVDSLDALDRVGGEDGTQSCSDPGNTQIFVKDEMHTTEESQSTVTDLNQEKHLAAEDKQVEHVGVIKDELIEFNTSRRLKSFVPSALIMIQDKVVPGDGSVSNRAMETLPDGLSIGTSQINESEDGIYSTQLLPKGALFGPYQGKILHDVKSTEQISKRYLWKIYKNGKLVHWLSGQDESLANWMRYVQYTSNSQQQNLEAFQHSGHLFFRAIKDIPPYSELVVKYGNRQSSVLGTANDQALHSDNNVIGGENDENGSLFRCEMCNILYTSEIVFHKHMHIKHSHSLPLHVYLQTEKDKTTRIDNNEEIPGHDRKIAKNRITAGSIRTRSSFRQLETKETSEQHKCLRKRDIKKLEETTYHCDVCNKIFTSLGNLQKHKLIHSNERPYACPICGRAFVQMSNMKNHVKIHNNEKHHVCSNCGKSFCRPNELRRHERYHSKEMPYICSVCNKGFKTVGNLKRHQTCHTGEKPYKCSVCGRDFNRLENLKTHMRCHTGEKPFQCTLCGNCFSTNAHLRVHMRRHSGEKPYVCSVCTKSFVDLTTLRAHSKIHNKGQCV